MLIRVFQVGLLFVFMLSFFCCFAFDVICSCSCCLLLPVLYLGTGQAETELSEAEPALLAAQSSVRSIKKPQLDEIRTLTR